MKRHVCVMTLVAVLGSLGGAAGAGEPEPQFTDIAGDANLVADDEDTRPASYDPADLRSVGFETTYVAIPVGDDGIDYRATGVVVRFANEATPASAGPTLAYVLSAGTIGGCNSTLVVYLQGPLPKPGDPPTGRIDWVQGRGNTCPNPEATISRPGWTMTIDAEARELVLDLPHETMTAAQQAKWAEGSRIAFTFARTSVYLTKLATGAILTQRIDGASGGRAFIVGEDMPEDVPCTQNCPE